MLQRRPPVAKITSRPKESPSMLRRWWQNRWAWLGNKWVRRAGYVGAAAAGLYGLERFGKFAHNRGYEQGTNAGLSHGLARARQFASQNASSAIRAGAAAARSEMQREMQDELRNRMRRFVNRYRDQERRPDYSNSPNTVRRRLQYNMDDLP